MIRIDLYSAAGTKLNVSPLIGTDIAEASCTQGLGKVSSFTLKVPAAKATELTAGRQAWMYFGAEGLVFKGQITQVETIIQGDYRYKLATGFSLARLALVKKTTLNRRFSNASLSSIMTALLSGNAYSAGELATPSTAFNIPFFGNTLWDALTKVADGFNLLLREDPIDLQVDVASFGDACGITFLNIGEHSHSLSENRFIAPISELKVISRTQDVFNKIIPLGQQQSIASTANSPWLTLQNSDRTSPYTIQNAVGPDGVTYYYIADAASVAEHGECERYLPLSFVEPMGTSATEQLRAANQLYDLAVTALLREKDGHEAYEVEVTNLTHRHNGQYTFRPGQTVRVQYRGTYQDEDGTETVVSVDRDLYLMEWTRTFSGDASKWNLKVSSIAKEFPTDGKILTDFISKVTGQQVVPLPFVVFGDNVARFGNTGLQFTTADMGDAIGFGVVPTGAFVEWLQTDFEGETVGDVVAGFTTPASFVVNNMFVRAHINGTASTEYGQASIGVWDDIANEFAVWLRLTENGDASETFPLVLAGPSGVTWMYLQRDDSDNFRLFIRSGGVYKAVGGGMELKVKEADETLSSNATSQNDDELLFAVAANDVAQFEGVLNISTGTSADFRLTFTGPSGAVGSFSAIYGDTASGDVDAGSAALGTDLSLVTGVNAGRTVRFWGGIHNGANAGNLQLQWAQDNSDVGSTTVRAGSYIKWQVQ